MKHTLIIFTVLFYGCSTNQKPNTNPKFETPKYWIENTSNNDLESTNICNKTNLSNQFDLLINFKRFSKSHELHDSCTLSILIKDKNSDRTLDSISMNSLFYFGDIFFNCDSMTSYSTKFNSNRQVVDNYFGDIVVADLNFDNKDDIAVINDSGGNGGPFYSYFIQTNNRTFSLDKFLTDSVIYFPNKIDKSTREIVTLVHAGACCVGKHIYHLDKTTNCWRETSHKILGL